MRITEKYVFFWGGEFSNWATVPGGIHYVTVEGEIVNFKTSEHLFMYLKAMYFKDTDIAEKITKADSPKEVKKLGRMVKGFSEDSWKEVREEMMRVALHNKAEAWPEFKKDLLTYGEGRSFVEASPFDTIWGIGLEETDPNVENESMWKGLNLLGESLDNVRLEIMD